MLIRVSAVAPGSVAAYQPPEGALRIVSPAAFVAGAWKSPNSSEIQLKTPFLISTAIFPSVRNGLVPTGGPSGLMLTVASVPGGRFRKPSVGHREIAR